MNALTLTHLALYLSVLVNFIMGAALAYHVVKNSPRFAAFKDALKMKLGRPVTKFNPNYFNQKDQFEALPQVAGSIIFLGDSLMAHAEVQEYFPGKICLNRGINADTPEGVLFRLSEVIARKPQKIFLMIGINDLVMDRPIEQSLHFVGEAVRKIRESSPQTQLIIQDVFPLGPPFNYVAQNPCIQIYNSKLKELAQKFQAIHLELYPHFLQNGNNVLDSSLSGDGLHLNGKGYQKWRQLVAPFI